MNNRIPGIIPGLRCPICGGNVYWEYDEDFGWERKCLPAGHTYKEPEPLTKGVNNGS